MLYVFQIIIIRPKIQKTCSIYIRSKLIANERFHLYVTFSFAIWFQSNVKENHNETAQGIQLSHWLRGVVQLMKYYFHRLPFAKVGRPGSPVTGEAAPEESTGVPGTW